LLQYAVQVKYIVRHEVRQGAILQVIPEVFDRVEFGSVRWQFFQRQSREVVEHGANCISLVHRSTVPYDGYRTAKSGQEGAEEIGCALLVHEGFGVGAVVKAQAVPSW